MNENFQASLDAVFADLDPPGPGGVSQSEYDAWRFLFGLPRTDVKQAPLTEIVAIYRQQYWVPECEALPIGVDYLFFDMKVKLGPYLATMILQDALGKGIDGNAIKSDGHFGVITMAAARAANPAELNEKLVDYKHNVTDTHPLKGLKIIEVNDRAAKMILADRQKRGVAA